MKITGGWSMTRTLFSEAARNVLDIAAPHRRSLIVIDGDRVKGARFNSDAAVLCRLESMFEEGEFMANVGPCVDKALLDAAASDWWYNNEKDYGDDSYFADEVECEDGADE